MKSFVIWGPNGTGKSGVVDALDFVLTGSISRLKGQGSGGLTVRKYAPHALRRDDPAAARVTVTIRDTATGQTARLSRSTETASTYSLDPDSPAMRAAVERIGRHPEVTLSRRDILKFILAEPGTRSSDVQALLKLDRLGEFRSALRSAKTKTSAAVKSADAAVETEIGALNRHFDTAEFVEADILKAVNEQRGILGLAPVTELDVDDLSVGVVEQEQAGSISKKTAARDVETLAAEIRNPSKVLVSITALEIAVAPVVAESTLLREMDNTQLVEDGLELLIDENCPLCDHGWPDLESLRTHLNMKLRRSVHAVETRDEIEEAGSAVADTISQVHEIGMTARRIAAELGVSSADAALGGWCGTGVM